MLHGFNSRDDHFVTPAERKALGTDNVPEFFMHFAIAGHELNLAWIDEILDARAWRIFDAAIHEAGGSGMSFRMRISSSCAAKTAGFPDHVRSSSSRWSNRSRRALLHGLATGRATMR